MRWYRQLHWQILIGLAAGLLWGLFAGLVGLSSFTSDYIRPFGTIFVNLLQLIAIPLVITSLMTGISNLNDLTRLSRMGGRTIVLYFITTVFAILFGLIVVSVIQPGHALPDEAREELVQQYSSNLEEADEHTQEVAERPPLQFLVDMVPLNVVRATSDNSNMIQVVFISILLGIGLINIPREKGAVLVDLLGALNDLLIRIVDLIMRTAPYGVFALMATVILDLAGDNPLQALNLIRALGWYTLAIAIGMLLHVSVVYYLLLRAHTRISWIEFMRTMQPAILLGFSTSSSLAALPVTMERVESLGVNEEVSGFVLPVGATVNMDGTSLYQAVAAVFIAQALGMDLTLSQQLTIVLTATFASIGTAGVPGAGILMLVIVLQSIQVPVEGIALILGVDRVIDMMRTSVNVTGDAAVAVAVASAEGLLGEPSSSEPDEGGSPSE